MAADEKDPDRLMELVLEINRLLEEKEQRLEALRQNSEVNKDYQPT